MNSKLVFFVLVLTIAQGAWLVAAADFVCPTQEGFYPVDDQCTGSYYTCVNGTAFPMQCPGITVFDPQTSTCVSLGVASCYVPTTTLAPFPCPSTEGFFPVPGECSSNYFVCVQGVSALQQCPFGAIFDPVYYKCTPAEQASCTQPFNCTGPDGLFPYPDACSGIYYNCTGGQSELLYCPVGTVFDPLALTCLDEQSASCTPGSTVPISTTTAAPVCPADGYFPIPGNCSVYLICQGGTGFVAPCPDGLLFNPNVGFCDFPENVPSCNVTSKQERVQQVFSQENIGKSHQLMNHVMNKFVCKNDGLYPLRAEGRFAVYYSCVGGIALPKACPGTAVFDPNQSRCS